MGRVNEQRCSALPLYGRDFQDTVKVFKPNKLNPWVGGTIHCLNTLFGKAEDYTGVLKDMLYNPERRIDQLKDICDRYVYVIHRRCSKCFIATKIPELEFHHNFAVVRDRSLKFHY